jgi:ribosome biogenesis GTPase / thiamine phosphate phosphatase
MNNLENYGWNNYYNEYSSKHNQGFEIGRVISILGFKYYLITKYGEIEAELSGKMLYGNDSEHLPKVGDWVFYMPYDTLGYIIDLLPRTNALTRKSPGNTTEKQVLAANIDYAFIVQSLDQNFNLARLERYIVQVLACGIEPIVILNKVDLTDNPAFYKEEVSKLHRNCQVYMCSTYKQYGIAEILEKAFIPAKTYILIGSSGVGKSSLLKALNTDINRETGSVSASTGKGKHVTTTRDMFRLPNGSLVIDTPGMREFGVAFDDAFSSNTLFPAIDELAQSCRYANCKHINETGCAVLAAFSNGSLEAVQYANYIKLVREQAHFALKAEDKKRIGKQFGKMAREVKEFKKKYK